MIFASFTLLVALAISAVAEYYSIMGLIAIFPTAFWPIVIMGICLGVGKINATLWLKINWERANWQFKLYLMPAVTLLMLLTAMGDFGFLSKSHIEQNIVGDDAQAQIQIFDDKIKTQKDNIESARRALAQMDAQVDQMLGRTDSDRGAERANQIRRSQQRERTTLQNEISIAQKVTIKLQEERAPIAQQVRKVEIEVGPIRYIAALVYGDNPDSNLLERAVRWVIILIVIVLDPLALVLILAANKQFEWARSDKARLTAKRGDEPKVAEKPPIVDIPDDKPAPKVDLPTAVVDVGDGRTATVVLLADVTNDDLQPIDQTLEIIPPEPAAVDPGSLLVEHPYLTKPWVWQVPGSEMKPMVYKPEVPSVIEPQTPGVTEDNQTEPVPHPYDEVEDAALSLAKVGDHEAAVYEEEVTTPMREVTETFIDPNTRVRTLTHTWVPDLSAKADAWNSTDSGFGTEFPESPNKGDTFLRVDFLPTKLFKHNGAKWMEINKSITDSYVFNDEYIKHLIAKISSGEYTTDDLSDIEQEQIEEFLNRK